MGDKAFEKYRATVKQALRIAAAVEKHLPELKELDEAGRVYGKDAHSCRMFTQKSIKSRNVIKDILKEIEG